MISYRKRVSDAFHDGMDKAIGGGAKRVKDATYKRLSKLAKYAARVGCRHE